MSSTRRLWADQVEDMDYSSDPFSEMSEKTKKDESVCVPEKKVESQVPTGTLNVENVALENVTVENLTGTLNVENDSLAENVAAGTNIVEDTVKDVAEKNVTPQAKKESPVCPDAPERKAPRKTYASAVSKNLTTEFQKVTPFEIFSRPIEKVSIPLQEVRTNPKVTCTDETDELQIYCYNNDLQSDEIDEVTALYRGLVYDSEGVLVSKAFSFSKMYTLSKNHSQSMPEELKEYIQKHMSECKFYPAYEGALVRVFFHKGQWYVTTHRKLNAFKSFWGSKKSFGTIFEESVQSETGKNLLDYLRDLDEKKQYVFLTLATPDTRIVCAAPPVSKTIHVGTFEDHRLIPSSFTGIPVQMPMEFESLSDARKKVVSMCKTGKYQGIVIYLPNETQVKVCSKAYLKLFALRGNESSIMYRYLQLRTDVDDCEMFKKLYPEHIQRFMSYEDTLQEIAKSILAFYIDRFIKRKKIIIPEEEFQILKSLESFRKIKSQSGPFRINIDDVRRLMNESPATRLNKMIHRHQLEAKKAAKK